MDCDAAASVLAEALLAVSAFAEDGLVAEDGLDPDAGRAGSACNRTKVRCWSWQPDESGLWSGLMMSPCSV